MSFFISNAYADTASSATSSGGNLMSLLMLVGFIGIFYFLLWRPQANRAREQRNLISNLAVGDEVVVNGGIMGKITKLDDNFAMLNISNSVEVKVIKNAITNVLPKGSLK